uniref:Uncharacterized protein n=1 Tax=Siphoviridae sp. ctpoI7 TaxID=2825678 RepID=A0A8S5P985_9CAUD|nr:MAG TPA: hypothetical protein [Siphoviridae sp. ctpoI7]
MYFLSITFYGYFILFFRKAKERLIYQCLKG